jgi:predicted Zn-ribbon and HTH transcriptional regulator
MESESVVFNGITYRRYPESKRRSDALYFTPNGTHRAKGVGRLHEEIWKAANGPIPDGYHVHHVDHDALNNSLDNLACIPKREHIDHHAEERKTAGRYQTPEWLAHLDSARAKASEWHGSPEGIEWHRENGRQAWVGREPVLAVCDQCGKTFDSLMPGRFCSNKCKSAWRRDSGVDDVERQCVRCGQVFTVNKYSKKSHCSRSCAMKDAREKERLNRT